MPSLSLRLRAESMEERILHSADIAPLLMAGAAADAVVQQQPLLTASADAEVQRSEIVFVDASAPDAATLLADLQAQRSAGRPIEIVIIGAGHDGVALISATLAGRSDITAVHVLAHGSDGVLQLGSVRLDAQTLVQRAGDVAGWSAALSADADLMLYGCDVAQTALGRQFVQDLAQLTGADVAASTDLTGAATLGGNWALEFGTGRIEAALAIDSAGQQAWAGAFAFAFTSESSGGSSTAVSSYNFSHNVNSGSDRLLMVQIVIGGPTNAATSVTYNGTSLTFLAGQDSPVGTFRVESWYLLAPPVGSGSVSVVLASSSDLIAGATSYSGVDQATPFGTPVTASGTNAAPSATVAAASGDLVVDIVGALGVSGYAIGAGQTQNFVQNLGSGLFDLWGVSSRENGAASVVMSESFTSVIPNWASIAVEINQVGSTAVITAAQDTYITSGSTNNYGTATGLGLDAAGGSLGDGRVLLQFDLSSIPAGATITGASLQMQATANNSTPATLNVYRLTQAWVEGNGGTDAANWNDRLPGTGWTTAGGAYDPAVVASLNAPAGPGVHSWDLTALATAWFAGSIVNTGVMLASPDTVTATFTYDSSEGTTAPRLVVTYTVANVAPTITSNGGGANATISVPENTMAVTTVTATDPDSGTLVYSLAASADSAKFSIDIVTGALRFVVPPNFEVRTDVGANNVYEVTVQVSDGSLTTSQAIAVTVSNVTEALLTTGEQRVNTVTTGAQETSMTDRGSHHAVAIAPSGNYVVVWSSQNQDGDGWGVYGQRYDNTGATAGVEFRINQVTASDQLWATVAMDVSGRFVVSWTSANQDGTAQSVYARLYNADGSANGSEFRVNTTATGNQYNSTVAMDANGNFVVVWQGNGPGDGDGIFGRRFNAAGGAIDATEFRVNTDLLRAHYDASVSMNASGAFAVMWDTNVGVQLRRYDSSGVALGGEINVDNGLTAGNGSIAIADDGSLVVVWREFTLDQGVYLQRYSSVGAPIGGAVIVNSTTLGDQTNPSIAMDGAGNFIVAWEGGGTGDGNGVFAQKYDAAGVAVGGEFRINTTTLGPQAQVSLAMLDLNNFVAAWSGQGTGDNPGVFARQYGALSFAPVITSNGGGEVAAINIAENTTAVTTVTATDADLPAQTLNYSIIGGADAALFRIDVNTGVLRFFAAPDFETRADMGADNVYDVIVQASDGTLSATQAIAVSVTNVNDNAPVSAAASATGPEDTLLAVTLSASDADSSVASFTVQALPANGTLYLDAARTTAVVAGTAYLASSDALTLYFWPAADWNGSTSFNFFATDDLGLAGAPASASLTISAVNDAPVAANASASTSENAVLNANVPAASDVDGTVASYALASGLGAGNGSLTFNADGTYVFDPGSDFDALAAGASRNVSFSYAATDNLGQMSAPATVTITVNGINNAALLSADIVNLTEADSASAISTTGVLSISDVDSPATFVPQTGTPGTYGSFSIDAVGAWIYTADAAHNEFVAGASYADSFTVSSADGTTTSVLINIVGSNDAPAGSAPAVSTAENSVLNANVPPAVDVDGTVASYTLVSGIGAGNGSLTFNVDGTYVFNPGNDFATLAAGASRDVSFTYTATDNLGLVSTPATVTLTVNGTNSAPVVADASAATGENTALNANVPAASDVDGSVASYALVAGVGAGNGSLIFNADGSYVFNPGSDFDALAAGASRDVSFTYAAIDDLGLASAPATVTITVNGSNDAPLLAAPLISQAATQGVAFSFTLPASAFADVDAGDTMNYRATLVSGAALPSWLAFNAATQTFSGTPGNADVGMIALRVTATDAANASVVSDFSLAVANVNDAPVLALPISDQGVAASVAAQFQLPTASFIDPDLGDTLHYAATLADGSALPAWLTFDSSTLTFSANAGIDAIGAFVVRVTASDDAGAAAQALFAVIVSAQPADTVPIIVDSSVPPAVPPTVVPVGVVAVPASGPPAVPAAPPSLSAAVPVAPAPDLSIDSSFAVSRSYVDDAVPSNGVRAASHADAVLGDAIVPEYKPIDLGSMISLLSSDDLLRKLEELQRNLLDPGIERRTLVASSIAATSGLSIGYVVWLVRGGVLVSSMLSALPAWQMIDPLPVVAAAGVARVRRARAASDDADVERLFDDQRESRPAPAPTKAPDAAAVAERGKEKVRT